jgi:D-sedoheptulose 7-phosphate isomerase
MTTWPAYLAEIQKIGDSTSIEAELSALLRCLLRTVCSQDGIIFTAGNGGSSSTAEHFSADLSQMKKRVGVNGRSVCLTSNVSLLSAISNDLDYVNAPEYIFSTLSNKNSLVVTFSASGNSENLVRLHKAASIAGVSSWAFLGFDGGKMQTLQDINGVLFRSQQGLYGEVENLHLAACHFLIDRLIDNFRNDER